MVASEGRRSACRVIDSLQTLGDRLGITNPKTLRRYPTVAYGIVIKKGGEKIADRDHAYYKSSFRTPPARQTLNQVSRACENTSSRGTAFTPTGVTLARLTRRA